MRRVVVALLLSAFAATAQEPWQRSWEEFIRAYQACLDNLSCDPSTFFSKEVIWQGQYAGTTPSATDPNVIYQLSKMPAARMRSRDGFTVTVAENLLHLPTDAANWQKLSPGATIRFRTRISIALFLANAERTCCFFVIPADGSSLVTEPGAPQISEVLDGAGLQPVIAPHGWVVIKGSDLASTTRTWTQSDFRGQAMPTNLDGTSVTINGKPAYVYYLSPTQLNVLAPGDTSTGNVVVEVTTRLGRSQRLARMDRYAPGLFMQDPDNRKYVAAVHASGGIVGRSGLYPASPNTTRPLVAGQRAQLYTSGWGWTEPAQPEGMLFSGARPIIGAEHLRVSIGGQPAQIEFAGAVTPGLYQINIIAPASLPSGDHPVQIDFGSYRTQPNAFITISGTAPTGQVSVSPTSLSFNHRVGQAAPTPASLQVSSSSGAVDFTAAVEGGSNSSWLSVNPTSGRTPANVSVSVNVNGLQPGTYLASIRVAGVGANVLTIPVSLTVTAAPASVPVIVSLTPNNGFPNELMPNFTVRGTGLESVTGIEFEPSGGISINSLKVTPTQVTAQLLVAGNAIINTRQVRVVTPSGRSNALPFQILVPSIVPSISNVQVSSVPSGAGATNTFKFDFTDGDRDILFKGGFGQSAQIEVDFSASQFIYNGCVDIHTGPPLNQPGQPRGTIELAASFSYSTRITSTAGIPILIRLRDSAGNLSNPVQVTLTEYYSACRALGVRQFNAPAPGGEFEHNSSAFTEPDGSIGKLDASSETAVKGTASQQ